MLDVFFSYSHRDESLRDQLETHLSLLKREGLIRPWHDRRIGAGEEWEGAIDGNLESAHLVLLLVSPDFLASDYCYDLEMRRALERHEAGEATVVPIILRPCDWKSAPFGKLQGLPKDVKPITSWNDRDEAFLDVARGLRRLVQEMQRRVDDQAVAGGEHSQALDTAYEERATLLASGSDTSEIDTRILHLKREMREGGRLTVGDLLADGRYKLQELLGQGGFAQVWKAYDRKRRDLVAVKVLHGQYGQDLSRRQRFFRGARQMGQLRGVPGVVDVLEGECEDGGFHFYVMEHLAGGDFRRAVLEGRLSFEQKMKVILETGAALHAAHERGLVHRDVKPANILLDLDGRPKLTDFDLVRAADTTGGTRTSKLGTFLFAAPEAMTDASRATAAADVYGLAMTAVFAIHGAALPPEALFDQAAFLAALEIDEPVRLVLDRGVARKIEDRWSSAVEFCTALESASALRARRVSVVVKSAPSENEPPPDEDESPPEPGDLWIDPAIGMRFRYIPPGAFQMGSPPDEPGRFPDEIQHEVTLTRGYWLGETPVTQAQWRAVMGTEPSRFSACGDSCPVEQVSWYEAVAFVNALSTRAGLPACYEVHGDNGRRAGEGLEYERVEKMENSKGYRLPTEAEWERAARSGTEGAIYTGDTTILGERNAPELNAIAWYGGNSRADYSGGRNCAEWKEKALPGMHDAGPQHVGRRAANPWQIYDMLGNVNEWCEDWYGAYEMNEVTDPTGPHVGRNRVIRGGSWFSKARVIRVAYRGDNFPPRRRSEGIGFRLARSDVDTDVG